MSAWQKFNCWAQDVGRKVHNMHTDILKTMLTNVAPLATNAVKADLTEIGAGNGYTAGGAVIAGTTWIQTAGMANLTGTDITITASGGTIGPFRYAAIYNDTAAGKPLIGFADRGSAVTLNDTESVLIHFPTDLLTLA